MSMSVKIILLFLCSCLVMVFGFYSLYCATVSEDIDEYKLISYKKRGKSFKKLFIRRFLEFITSFGLVFFIIAHLYGTPIVYRMSKDSHKVNRVTEKNAVSKKNTIKLLRLRGFPTRRVFAT